MIAPNPDEADEALVQTFHEFVTSHWFFNGREKGPIIVPKTRRCEEVNENSD